MTKIGQLLVQFPLMLKPANLAKSLLITKNHNQTELIENYRKTMQRIDVIYQKKIHVIHLVVFHLIQNILHQHLFIQIIKSELFRGQECR